MTAADALRRLLADVEAARDWRTGAIPAEPVPSLQQPRHADVLDYLERLALDGLAGEATDEACLNAALGGEHGKAQPVKLRSYCDSCREKQRIASDEPTNEGQP